MEDQELLKLLKKMEETIIRKRVDYSSAGFYQNFDRSAELISWFKNDTDKAFVSLIGTKLARLATLLDSGREPLNESVDDSFLDLYNYCALWASYHSTMRAEDFKRNHAFMPHIDRPSFCSFCNLHESSHKESFQ